MGPLVWTFLISVYTNSKQIDRHNNVRVIQRIRYRAEKRNAETKKNVNAYKRLEVVAYRGVGKRNKEIGHWRDKRSKVLQVETEILSIF
jgi:hypothetical protein